VRLATAGNVTLLGQGGADFAQRQTLGVQLLLIHVLPVDGAARTPFLGARAILVFSDLSRVTRLQPEMLSQIFGLSLAEAKVAALMASGHASDEIADAVGVTRETVRKHLKAVFAKTATHRQAELVALLALL
jgi:DNA-binding CsgD family transcriptional regulator